MKKKYVKPTFTVEVIDVELPISTSLPTSSNPDNVIDGENNAFLTKGLNDWSE